MYKLVNRPPSWSSNYTYINPGVSAGVSTQTSRSGLQHNSHRINSGKHHGECGSISVSEQLHTFPSPDPILTLTCYQLTDVGLGHG